MHPGSVDLRKRTKSSSFGFSKGGTALTQKKAQTEKFRKAARDLECDESEDRFKEALKRLRSKEDDKSEKKG